MLPKIRACTKEDIPLLAELTRRSFADVAERFNLSRENAPRHPSNCTDEWVSKDMERGVCYFILEEDKKAAGCVAVERASPETWYLERLAVLPEHRKRGRGKALAEHALAEAGRLGARSVGIGIIAEQAELKNWYRKLGFMEGESRDFPHLPFRVTFMACPLD